MLKPKYFGFIARILARSAPSPESHAKFVETILSSEAMKTLYSKMVTSFTRNKDSFRSFYERVLESFIRDQRKGACGEIFAKLLS